MKFSSMSRNELLNRMATNEYDLLVIGGGITGAGIALDATLRGMKVALVEMQDFAAGTSSRSTKLVHGGLRYLKQFQIGLVAEVGKERAIVYENGPHVTTPEWMLLPIFKGGTFGRFTTSIGLRIYDYLANVKTSERRQMLSRDEVIKKVSFIRKDGLRGGGHYVEYRTDDARLTIEVVKAAVACGAHIINYAMVEEFIYDAKKVAGVRVKDLLSDLIYTIKALKVVNACGPWVDEIRKKGDVTNDKHLRLTKGVHLVMDQSIFPLQQAVYFDTPDGRMVFVIPRDGKTYVGTTDTLYEGDIARPKVLNADLEYLLNALHFMFPDVNVTENDVESSWAGVRPLIYEEGKDPSEISRRDEIWEAESGLITIAGGKLTGYRKMAESVVNLVSLRLAENGVTNQFKKCETMNYPISGGDVGGSKGFPSFVEEKAKEASQYGFTEEEGRFLAGKYGSNVDKLFAYGKPFCGLEEVSLSRVVYAQLMYAIEHEMATKPVDFFIRRTGALYFNIDWVRQWKEVVIGLMAEKLGWTLERKAEYKAQLERELEDAVNPIDLEK